MRLDGFYRAMVPVDRKFVEEATGQRLDDNSGIPCIWVFGEVFKDMENRYHIEGKLLGKDDIGRYVISDMDINTAVRYDCISRYTNLFDSRGIMIFERDYLGNIVEGMGIYLPSMLYIEKYGNVRLTGGDGVATEHKNAVIANTFGDFCKVTENIIEKQEYVVVGNMYQNIEFERVRAGKSLEDFRINP